MGLALVGVFATSAMAMVSTASAALPEFKPVFGCSEKAGGTGEYATFAECETVGGKETKGGKFHRHAKFTSTSGKGTLETVNGTKVSCTSDSDAGEVTGPKSFGNVFVIFKGCESSGFKCETAGAETGEIKTKELSGGLGYLNASKKEVGVDLKPASGELFVEFQCLGGIVKVKVRGSVIGKITPVNTKTKTFTLTYKESKGTQEFTKFEGGSTDTLETSKNGKAFEGSAEETTDTNTTEEEAEIMA